MPKLTGVFEKFINIEKVTPEQIGRWLKAKEQSHIIENFIGNRLIYPQTVAVSAWDMDMDLAILREYIKLNKAKFYHYNLPPGADPKQAAFAKKIILVDEFLKRFPPVIRLLEAYLDALEIQGVVTVLLNKEVVNTVVGSIIVMKEMLRKHSLLVSLDDKPSYLQDGVLNLVKNPHRSVKIQVNNESPFVVPGGELGVVFDLRN